MDKNETVEDIEKMIRSTLKISGLSLDLKKKFCETAKRDFNDSYSAYLSFLMQRSEDYERLLNFNAPMKILFEMINELSEQVKSLKKEVEKK